MKVLAALAALVASAAAVEVSLRVPTTNKWNYGDPSTGCMPSEMNVSVTGVSGDFCSPPCSGSTCPTNYPPGVTAQGQCVLEVNGGTTPTYCALICDPSSKTSCGKTAKCQPIQGVGVCTYSK